MNEQEKHDYLIQYYDSQSDSIQYQMYPGQVGPDEARDAFYTGREGTEHMDHPISYCWTDGLSLEEAKNRLQSLG